MLIQLPESPDGTETSVGDLVTKISNIGSSGQDGVRFDSFFDIDYQIDFDPPRYRTVETEMLSMQLSGRVADPSNPGTALDALRRAVSIVGGDVIVAHVTILK